MDKPLGLKNTIKLDFMILVKHLTIFLITSKDIGRFSEH